MRMACVVADVVDVAGGGEKPRSWRSRWALALVRNSRNLLAASCLVVLLMTTAGYWMG